MYICDMIDSKIMKGLAQRIKLFIEIYARISPNFDVDDVESDKYTGPDPYQMLDAANLLDQNIIPIQCWSEWESGCYGPYTSVEGRLEHSIIMDTLTKIKIDGKKL